MLAGSVAMTGSKAEGQVRNEGTIRAGNFTVPGTDAILRMIREAGHKCEAVSQLVVSGGKARVRCTGADGVFVVEQAAQGDAVTKE